MRARYSFAYEGDGSFYHLRWCRMILWHVIGAYGRVRNGAEAMDALSSTRPASGRLCRVKIAVLLSVFHELSIRSRTALYSHNLISDIAIRALYARVDACGWRRETQGDFICTGESHLTFRCYLIVPLLVSWEAFAKLLPFRLAYHLRK